jgi:hypothetical protein
MAEREASSSPGSDWDTRMCEDRQVIKRKVRRAKRIVKRKILEQNRVSFF